MILLPASASSAAAIRPDRPAPTMITSASSAIVSLPTPYSARGRFIPRCPSLFRLWWISSSRCNDRAALRYAIAAPPPALDLSEEHLFLRSCEDFQSRVGDFA